MGKVSYSPGIEFVSGSLAKPKKKDGHNHGDYLIGTHRVAPTTNTEGCTRLYIRKGDTYKRTTPLSSDETEARTRFSEVASAVALRKKNLSQVAQDRAAFNAQKDEPGGKKTLKAYLWKVCGDAYDQQHNG